MQPSLAAFAFVDTSMHAEVAKSSTSARRCCAMPGIFAVVQVESVRATTSLYDSEAGLAPNALPASTFPRKLSATLL
jgi:hypothetical protein